MALQAILIIIIILSSITQPILCNVSCYIAGWLQIVSQNCIETWQGMKFWSEVCVCVCVW